MILVKSNAKKIKIVLTILVVVFLSSILLILLFEKNTIERTTSENETITFNKDGKPTAREDSEVEVPEFSGEVVDPPENKDGKARYIVKLKNNLTDVEKEELVKSIGNDSNVEILEELQVAIVEGDGDTKEQIEKSDLVETVQEDKLRRAALSTTIGLINADDVYSLGYDGTGMAVAILDTGVDSSHAFLNVVSEACYSNAGGAGSGTSLCPGGGGSQTGAGAAANCTGISGCDHGTHVAGIAAGDGDGATFTGVAKDAGIIAIQVFTRFNDSGICSPASAPCLLSYDSDQISGLNRVLALHNDVGFTDTIASVNLSLGGGAYSDQATCDSDNSSTKSAIDSLRSAGIVTFAASGNEGSTTNIIAPACISTAIAVGSTTDSDNVSGFSNSNALLDVWAPGSSITSSVIGTGNFGTKSGTSMATPHAAGFFAVLKEAFPSRTVSELITAMEDGGVDITDSGNGITRPRIDLLGAYNELAVGGVTITEVDTTTGEDETTATVQFELVSEPTADVTIPLSLSDTTEGTLSGVTEVVIAQADWNVPTNNEITITGVDDDLDDGDIAYNLVTGDPTSSDSTYDNLGASDVDDVSLTNSDNDTAGVSITATDTTTGEDGATATVQFELDAEPTNDVTIALSVDDTSEGTVASDITITPANWDIPANNEVTITGINDNIIDGTVGYNLVTGEVTSSDSAFDSLDGSDVADQSLTNADDDSAGINVIEPDLQTDEDMDTATVQFTLDSIPTNDVTIPLSLTDTSEGDLGGVTQIVITPANWNIASNNSVTITGVDDDQIDGNIGYTLTTGDVASSDTNYNALDASNVADSSLTNNDNDTAGAIVSSISEVTTEGGDTATFTIALTSEPTNDVTIALSSTDTAEGTVASSITITTANWNNPSANIVTVTGQDDVVIDGSTPYTIVTGNVTSSDSDYNALDGSTIDDVSVSNQDDDTAAVLVTVPDNETSEAATTGTVRFALSSQPTDDVTIQLSISDTTEGTLSGVTEIVIDDLDWNVPTNNEITITGVDDNIDDGDLSFSLVTGSVTSNDANYNSLGAGDVADPVLTNNDDDTAGVNVTAISGNTNEALGTATFQMSLDSEPTADVVVALSSSDTSEGTVASSITITPANWNIPANNEVTVTGVDDLFVDGDIDYSIVTGNITSSDSVYNTFDGSNVADVSVTNDDNDVPDILVSSSDSQTGEDGDTAIVRFQLTSEPSGDVTVPLSLDDTKEGTLSGVTQIVISIADWNTPANNEITITGLDDNAIDGTVDYNLVTGDPTSSDSDYDSLGAGDVNDVALTNVDDDSAGVIVTEVDVTTDENFSTATLQFSLTSEPTADVTIPVSVSDTTEGSIGVTINVVIAVADWNNPSNNELTITGVNDDIADGDILYSLITGDVTSSDSDYNALGASDVADSSITNFDNDIPNIIITENFGSTDVVEGGSGDSFEVVLSTEPTNDVVITVSPNSEIDIGSGAGTSDNLTFTDSNWDTPQEVSVDGDDDNNIEGNHSGSIGFSVASSDSSYNGFSIDSISVAIEDNDSAGITVTDVDVTTDESGATATVQYELTAIPTSAVTIPLSIDDSTEGTLSGVSSVVISPANWNIPANNEITVTGVDDNIIDGDIGYNLVTGDVASSDSNFDALDASDAADSSLTNGDDDTAGVNVTSISGNTDENGTTATFEITLDSQPTDDVTIALSVDDSTEGDVTSSITITAANWNNGSANTVTVAGEDDDQIDGPVGYNVVTGDVTSSDSDYDALDGNDVSDVAVTNQDNDSAGITLSTTDGTSGEDTSTATVQFQLTSEPANDVTIPLSLDDTTEGTLSGVTQIIISTANWNVPANNEVTIIGVNDDLQDGDVIYRLITGDPTSSDSDYNILDASDVSNASLTNTDDDVASVSINTVDSTTGEDGSSATVQFQLGSEPTDNVTIALSVDDSTEGSVPSSITITPANWNIPANNQVTITGVNDTDLDGTVAYNLITGDVTSNNSFYNALGGSDVADVALTNTDNDIDTDGDFVSDEAEAVDSTDETDATDYKDSDSDKVPDIVEFQNGTDETDDADFQDSDGGGTPDYVELYRFVAEGLTATDETDDADDDRDADSDGAPDYIEICEGTDPNDGGDVLDSDNDGEIDYEDTDDDNDGIPDAEEESGPNDGDANGDGIKDSKQANVASSQNSVGGGYVAFESGSGSVTEFGVIDESSLAVDDESVEYPVGLFDFAIEGLINGETVTIEIYLDQVYDTSDWLYKKYNPATEEYADISSSVTYGTAVVGSTTVTTISYDITDGGVLDLDGEENGEIIDPSGPSVFSITTLPSTGFNLVENIFVGAGIITLIFVFWFASKRQNRKKKFALNMKAL